jgi:cyclohexanecarboxyl-CoA dehydrogenase
MVPVKQPMKQPMKQGHQIDGRKDMDFGFSEEQEAVREAARRYAADRLAPAYATREAAGCVEQDLLAEMGRLGFIGADLPEEAGGHGLDCVTAGLITEAIAYGDFNVSYVPLLASLQGSILAAHASTEVARAVIPEICAGQSIVALGLTEPGGGSDAANLRLRARRDGTDFVLDGEKTSISFATQADRVILFARTGEPEDRAKGVSAFLVSLNQEGVSRTAFDDLGSAAVGRGSIFFDGVRVAADKMIGDEGQGFRQVMNGFDYSRALIGLQCLAAARASLDETWGYITERQAFGKPIAAYQGVTQPLAEAETLLEAARLVCYKTLWLRDQDLPHTAEAAMCKWWAPQLAFDVIHRCLITHGHLGYARDLPHQQRLRDVLGLQIGDGTEQIQKMIIAREKVGRVAVPY